MEPTNPDNPNEIVVDLNHTDFSDLGSVGGYAYKGNIIVFRTGNNTYMALSKVCTHSQCTITYSHADGDLPCPCHGSKFTTGGAIKNGPVQTNLKSYTVKKRTKLVEANISSGIRTRGSSKYTYALLNIHL